MIFQDVQYGDIDIMERALDFTYDNVSFHGLPEYIMELKGKGIKFITILVSNRLLLLKQKVLRMFKEITVFLKDPGISFREPAGTYPTFDLGTEMDVW